MNDRRLRIYLDDHLALVVGEVELIARCRWSNRRTPLGQFLQQLENEVKAQKSIVRDVIHRLGDRLHLASQLKQGGAWFAEKFGRFKLNDSLLTYSELSRVIELETLMAAAQARIVLWDTLDAVASADSRLEGITISYFREQSQQHFHELSTRRRFAAAEAFTNGEVHE